VLLTPLTCRYQCRTARSRTWSWGSDWHYDSSVMPSKKLYVLILPCALVIVHVTSYTLPATPPLRITVATVVVCDCAVMVRSLGDAVHATDEMVSPLVPNQAVKSTG
jgi:hypothetical protein